MNDSSVGAGRTSSPMQVVVQQSFPLGRFHATPWRVSPFDDRHGEWPPSPWRFIRAVVARWHQLRRESGDRPDGELEGLVHALCNSRFAFLLPTNAERIDLTRSYQPMEFGWNPAQHAGERSHGPSLTRDNCWVLPPDREVYWFLTGDAWTAELLTTLDACLARVLYFGRAESLTVMSRDEIDRTLLPNVELTDSPRADSDAPVLAPEPSASLDDVQRTTDELRKRTVPYGARWMYATLPCRSVVRDVTGDAGPATRPAVKIVQFAVGVVVAPTVSDVCALTSRFRERVARLGAQGEGHARGSWRRARPEILDKLSLLSGRAADGTPMRGHRHVRVAMWFGTTGPERLLVWRDEVPFEEWELDLLAEAARKPLAWSHSKSAPWSVQLIPLPVEAPCPAGFDGKTHRVWGSVTPYVPGRTARTRGDAPERFSDVCRQVQGDLARLGYATDGSSVVAVDGENEGWWTSVHVPPASGRASSLAKRMGYRLRIEFSQPVSGPIAIGHSSHYGLGLFLPTW